MRIPLSEIKGLDRRVRQQMSPEKLEELSESLKELGQIVPVKVRPNGKGYVLVYGHRRVMAAKAAGMKEIEAIVDELPEDRVLTQALAENVIREDMAALDIAKALQAIIDETGCSREALAKKMGWAGHTEVSRYLDFLEPEIRKVAEGAARAAPLTVHDVREAKAGTDNLKDAAKVLKYASEKDLSTRETRQVAEAVRSAAKFGGDKAVTRVLARPAAEIIRSAETLPKAKPKATVRPTTAIHFEWLKDSRLGLAEDAVAAISSVVSAMARSDQDRKGAKAALKIIRSRLATALDQVDRVLRDM